MVVLDTCAFIWLVNRNSMSPLAIRRIDAASASGNVVIPAVALFEVATLSHRGRIDLEGGLERWLDRATELHGVRVEPLSGAVALDAAALPGLTLGDPADQFVIATARVLDAPVVTRDKAILAYGRTGHVDVIRC